MNKKNKILVGCLALLLALSVGYALFSDTITINGTATAKGSFDITADCTPGILSKLGTAESLGLNKEVGYENDSCTVVDDSASFKTDFLYPGARRYFTVKLTNTGTIDAHYIKADSTVKTEELCVADDLEGNNLTCNSTPNSSGTITHKNYRANMARNILALEDPDGNLLTQSESLEFYDPNTGNVILKPGYSGYFYFNIWLSYSSEYPSNEMNVSYNSTFKINIVQFTD